MSRRKFRSVGVRQHASQEDSESVGMVDEAVDRQPAAHRGVQPSRDPLDDPELARYLQTRTALRSADHAAPSSQELTDKLLSVVPSFSGDREGSPRPNLLAGYAALLAGLKENIERGLGETE